MLRAASSESLSSVASNGAKWADAITVHLTTANAHPPNTLVHRLVRFARGADVRDLIVEGGVVMRDRVVLQLDELERMGGSCRDGGDRQRFWRAPAAAD